MKTIIYFLSIFGLIHFFFEGRLVMAYEEPKFTVLEKLGKIEIRNYESYLVAQAEVNGDRQSSGTQGFKILAGYIFGQNEGDHTIAMTAPVVQTETKDRWVIQFMMPTKYHLENLPKPKNKAVQFKTIPAKKIAAITYSGRWTDDNYFEHLEILKKELEKTKLKPKGEPLWARYNSPFTPWFLRKNEILIEVE